MFIRIRKEKIFLWSFLIMIIFLDSRYLPGGNIAVLVLLINLIQNVHLSFPKGKMITVLVGYIGYILLTTIFHLSSNYDISNSTMYFVEISIIIVSCCAVLYKTDIVKLMKLIRNVGIILGTLGILEGVIKYPYLSYVLKIECKIAYDPSGYRIVSIFGHPIIAGVFFLFCWCALLIVPCKRYVRNIMAQLIIVLAIALTRSRSIWLSFLVIICLLLSKKIMHYKNKIPREIVFHIGQIILLYFFLEVITGFKISRYIFQFFSSRIVGSLYAGKGAGNIIRIDTVLNSIEYWENGNLEKLIFGMGKNYDKYFMQLYPVIKYGTVWTAAIDNQYFTTLHEAGVIGLIPILMILIIAIGRIIRANYNNRIEVVSNVGIVGIYVSLYFYEGLNYMSVLMMLVVFICLSDKYGKIKCINRDCIKCLN